jgi:hypothetical protein
VYNGCVALMVRITTHRRRLARVLLVLLLGGCQSTVVPSLASASATAPTRSAVASTPPSLGIGASSATPTASVEPSAAPSPVAGGCGTTQVYAGPGPDANLGLADNPWASASPADAGIVAYFWHSPPDIVVADGAGGGSKVLWVSHADQTGHLKISAHPLAASSPVVLFDLPTASSPSGNYPSGIDLPSPGCWTLDLTLGSAHATIDLMVAASSPS